MIVQTRTVPQNYYSRGIALSAMEDLRSVRSSDMYSLQKYVKYRLVILFRDHQIICLRRYGICMILCASIYSLRITTQLYGASGGTVYVWSFVPLLYILSADHHSIIWSLQRYGKHMILCASIYSPRITTQFQNGISRSLLNSKTWQWSWLIKKLKKFSFNLGSLFLYTK